MAASPLSAPVRAFFPGSSGATATPRSGCGRQITSTIWPCQSVPTTSPTSASSFCFAATGPSLRRRWQRRASRPLHEEAPAGAPHLSRRNLPRGSISAALVSDHPAGRLAWEASRGLAAMGRSRSHASSILGRLEPAKERLALRPRRPGRSLALRRGHNAWPSRNTFGATGGPADAPGRSFFRARGCTQRSPRESSRKRRQTLHGTRRLPGGRTRTTSRRSPTHVRLHAELASPVEHVRRDDGRECGTQTQLDRRRRRGGRSCGSGGYNLADLVRRGLEVTDGTGEAGLRSAASTHHRRGEGLRSRPQRRARAVRRHVP